MTTVNSDSSQSASSERSFKFREAVLSDVGLRRNENQDAFGTVHSAQTSLFIVADGMGGARGGATASSIAINMIGEKAFRENGTINRQSLKAAIDKSNTAIFQRSKRDEDLAGMGTTVVALAFVKNVAILAHVGDSRIYHIRVDTVRQLTRDHTLVQELVDSGAIPIEEAENHPIAHMLTRSLGPSESVEVDVQALGEPLESGDKFLLCSDGLYNLVNEQEILREVSSKTPEEATRALVDLALERGGTDNVTVQVVEVLDATDESFSAEYPTNGELGKVHSQGVDFGGMERLLREVEEFEQQQAALRESAAAAQLDAEANGSGTDAATIGALATATDLEVVDDEVAGALAVDSMVATLPQVDSEPTSQKVRLQLGMLFVIGLFGGVLAVSVYQLQKYRSQVSVPVDGRSVSGATADPQRDQLDEELENFATDTPQPTEPVSNENLPAIPALAGIPNTSASAELIGEVASTLFDEYVAQLEIGPPPRVLLSSDQAASQLTRPIVWEHESRRVERLLATLERNSKEGDAASVTGSPDAAVSIFSEDEIYAMVGEKEKARERIGDLDTKLELLMIETRADAEQEFEAVRQSVEGIKSLVERKRLELDGLKAKVVEWDGLKAEATGRRVLDVINKLGILPLPVEQKKLEYDNSSRSYFEAVDRWEKNPSDVTLASEMGALGRNLQAVRVEFESTVKLLIEAELRSTIRRVGIAEIEVSYLDQTVARLSRKEGFLKGFVPFSAERKAALRDAFLNERSALVSRFSELASKISAEEEISFRRRWLERELLGQPQLAAVPGL